MKNKNRISDSEWSVMRVIWDNPGLSASEILPLLDASVNWSQKTVNTFLSRLEKKEILSSEKIGRVKHYHSSVTEADCQKTESDFFLKKVFQGRVGPALLHFVESEQLTENEISQLRALIDNPKDKEK